MLPTYGPVDVKILDDSDMHGEVMTNAKVTTLGRRAKLYQWYIPPMPEIVPGRPQRRPEPPRFVEYDTLDNVEATEIPERNMLVITGQSQRLIEEVAVPPDMAQVVWEIDLSNNCENCG